LELRIEIAPHCSLTPGSALTFFGSLLLLSLAVALFFVVQGLWPVLPFWGIEMLVLGLALNSSLQRRHYRQIVLISESLIRVITCSRDGEKKQEFSRHWAKVKLASPRTNLYPSRLLIESHGRAFEVGDFLTEEDRRRLAVRLQAIVGRLNESPPLQLSRDV
jgi:uncharacterized membrane protein